MTAFTRVQYGSTMALLRSPLTTSRVASHLRQWGWRLVFDLTGGLSVSGPLPTGPAIVTPNHQSHADSAAIIAAIPASQRPVMAAAADYWYSTWWKRTVASTSVGVLPVYRQKTGAYAALQSAVGPVLAEDRIVVIFPEGTRATTDEMGKFQTGAVRLAKDLEVPIIPAAILGTRDVLPKNGRFRLRPIEIRFDAPFVPPEPITTARTARLASEGLRERITDMRGGAIKEVVSPIWRGVSTLAGKPAGLAIAFGWGFVEAISSPLIGELEIAAIGASVPRSTVAHSVAVCAGSVAGVSTHVWLRRKGVNPPLPLVTVRMRTASAALVAKRGSSAVWAHSFSGMPLKAYAEAVAATRIPIRRIAAVTAVEGAGRMLSVGLMGAATSHLLQKQARRVWGRWMLVDLVVWGVAQHKVNSFWSDSATRRS